MNGSPMQISVDEIIALLGQKDIEILVLQKQIAHLKAELAVANPKDTASVTSIKGEG